MASTTPTSRCAAAVDERGVAVERREESRGGRRRVRPGDRAPELDRRARALVLDPFDQRVLVLAADHPVDDVVAHVRVEAVAAGGLVDAGSELGVSLVAVCIGTENATTSAHSTAVGSHGVDRRVERADVVSARREHAAAGRARFTG